MCKFYAYQVAPEYQESPLWRFDGFPDSVSTFGNKDFREHKTVEFDWILKRIKEMQLADDLYDVYMESEGDNPVNVSEYRRIIHECFSSSLYNLKPECIKLENIENMDDETLVKLADCIINMEYTANRYVDDKAELCFIVSTLTGEQYAYRRIRGSSQGDVNWMFYRVDEWTDEELDNFEVEYWNEGSEWDVRDAEEVEDENADAESLGTVYCHSWNWEDMRDEIAQAFLVSPDEVELFEFDGWIKRPKYKKVK